MDQNNITHPYILGKCMLIDSSTPYLNSKGKEYNKKRMKFLKENGLTKTKEIKFITLSKDTVKKNIYNANNVVFEVTEKCNLNCVYCINGDLYGNGKKHVSSQVDMPKEYAFKLLEFLSPFWHERRVLGTKQTISMGFYGGEPLLNISLIKEIVEWTKLECNIGLEFRFYLTTNGTIIDKHIDFLIKHNFYLHISLDGNSDHNVYRTDHKGEKSFDKVYNNIKNIQSGYPDYFAKNVEFLSVSHNKNPLNHVYDFFSKEFNKLVSPSNLNDTGINAEKRAFFEELNTIPEASIPHDIDKQIIDKGGGTIKPAINFIYFFSGFLFSNYNDLLWGGSNAILTYPTGACTPFSMKIFMNAHGEIFPCESFGSRFDLGNIKDDIIFDTEKIAEKYNQWYETLAPICSVCQRKYSCNKCLFNIPDIDNKPHCDKMMNQEVFPMHFNGMIQYLKKNPGMYYRIMKENPAIV